MRIFLFILTLSICVLAQKHNITQVTTPTFLTQLQRAHFSLVYVYSSSCGYCQHFTPLYEKLSTDSFFTSNNVRFLKADEHLFDKQKKKFAIHSFPTLMLFWKDFSDHPIFFRQQRNEANIKSFVQDAINIRENQIQGALEMSPYQKIQEKIVLYYGQKNSPLYKTMGLAANRDKFFQWKLISLKSGQQEKIIIGNKKLEGFNITIDQIQTTIQKVFARVHKLGQEPWVRIFLNKQLGIVHVNPLRNKKYAQLLEQLSKQYYNLVFMELTPDHHQYKAALQTFIVPDQQNIIAVDRKSEAVFMANRPYNKASLEDFIQKVQKYEWPVHKKTQKTTKQEKLTRQNFKQKMSTNQDVVLFLYRRQQKISQNLIGLFNHLRTKMKENKNLLFLRCDVASNQIEEYLQFAVEKTPKLVFYRNRMKDRPIHFSGNKISEQSVIEFIMENTTFDWKDEWGEL